MGLYTGETPLYIASAQGHPKVVDVLTSAGAVVDAVRRVLQRPLAVAAINGHSHVVERLVAAGADISARNYGIEATTGTPLAIACKLGHASVVACLLDAGANPNVSNVDGCTPLLKAASAGHYQVAKLLV